MKKRILSTLLMIMMVFSCLPTSAFAAASEYKVQIHTTATDIEFKDAANAVISATKSTESAYNVYSLQVKKGTYTYTAPGYGTGTIKITGEADIYLRIVNYTFSESGCSFQMKVTNTADTELVYSSRISSGKSANLLLPALGWGIRYQYQFVAQDDSYCPFYGDLWVLPGKTDLEGFKSTNYNLSDSGKYVMGKKSAVEFRVPAGASLGIYALVKFYCPSVEYETKYIKTEDGYDVYEAYVADPCGGNYYYTVSKQGCVTTSAVFQSTSSSITVTEENISGDPNQQVKQTYEASLISNGNVAKSIRLNVGEEFAIWTSRAWQAIDSITANRYVEPDKHYYVIAGDSVTVDDIGTVTAVKNGISIVAVTYDAMNYEGNFYSAVKSDSIGVFAFLVGGSSEGLSTGLSALSDLDSFYFAKTLKVDGSPNVLTKEYATYTFTPSVTDNSEISVSSCAVYGYPSPAVSAWQNYPKNEDGSFTVRLYEGRNVVKIQSGDQIACHVINCKGSDVSISNVSAPGTAPKADESVEIGFSNIITPQPKLGAIYNPGYGGTVYLTGTLINDADNSKAITVNSSGVQYSLSSAAAISADLTDAGNYTLSGTRIHAGAFGSAPTAHLALSRQSDGGSYTGGDTPATEGMYSYLPELSFTVESADQGATAATLITLFNDIGKVTYDETCHARILKARNAYDSASTTVKALISPEQLRILTDAEKAYALLDEAAVGSAIEKREFDGQEFYVLNNAAQLGYFAKLVNGTLADGTQDTSANAVLEDDITVNPAVLGDNFTLLTASASEWTPIGSSKSPFTGIFDGNGHAINGIYINTQDGTSVALFGTNSGTIRNFTLGDTYIRTAAKAVTGVAGIAVVNKGTIENVSYNGYVGAEDNVGGIAATNNGTVSCCVFSGKAEATGTVTSYAGGIAYYSNGKIIRCVSTGMVLAQNGETAGAGGIVCDTYGTVEYCYSSAIVTGRTYAGGIVGTLDSGSAISACYNVGKVTANKNPAGGIFAAANGSVSYPSPSYYLADSAENGADIDDKVISKTAAQFADGEAAYLLGSEYGQQIGTDLYPVFNNSSNQVFQLKDGYANASVESAILMIDSIGNVAADGSDNCFSNVTEASACYAMLTETEKAKVRNADVLEQKKADYNTAVTGLIAQIAALFSAGTDSGSAISAAKTAFLGYISRGGDDTKIANASLIPDAMTEYYASLEESIAGGIETRTMGETKYYVLTNAQELMWFAKSVNGTLQSGLPADPNANAILANDISVNDNLLSTILDQGGNIIDAAANIETAWNPIGGSYGGVFDGNGHTVSGLYFSNSRERFAMFNTVSGTVKNVRVADSYAKASIAAGLVLNTSGLLDRCSFDGVIDARMQVGGITHNVSGTVSNCYSSGKLSLSYAKENASFMGGIAAFMNNCYTKNCYSICTYSGGWSTGGIAGCVYPSSQKIIENCYYLNSCTSKGIGTDRSTVTMDFSACSPEQMSSGEIAYQLGSAFGERIGTDSYPIVNDGSNTVYYANGAYVNSSVETAITLISEIGTVALDGGENCFSRTVFAKNCYDELSDEEKGKVSNTSVLTDALAAYDNVLSKLEEDIDGIYPLNKTDCDTKYNAVCADIDKYFERGGDIEKISNYAKLQSAADELEALLVLWRQEDVEENIKTKTIGGEKYYVLTSADELLWFAGLVNGTLKTETSQNAAANAVLDANISLNQNLMATILDGTTVDDKKLTGITVWAPIESYTGSFDGAGHTVSGIYYTNFGMFKSVSGTVKNLHVADSVIYGISGSTGTGGIVGVVNVGGSINGCSFSGLVQNKASVGGLVGVNNGSISLCCVTDTNIISYGKTFKVYAGGLVGNNQGTIENSYARAAVKSTNNGSFAASCMGGITGNNSSEAKVSNCYSSCTVTGIKRYIAGIAGQNEGDVKNCYYLEGTTAAGIGAMSDSMATSPTGQAESKTAEQFADGSVAAALGDAYAQRINVDTYPVFLKDVPAIEVLKTPDGEVQLGETVTLSAVLAKGTDAASYQWYSNTENSNESGTAIEEATSAIYLPDTGAVGTTYYYCVSGEYTSEAVGVEVIQTYKLTVVNGIDISNAGPYAAGTQIEIKANEPEDGERFAGWTCNEDNGVFENSAKANTSFTMPAADTVITASYRTISYNHPITVYFTLLGDSKHDSGICHTLKQNNLETWIPKTKVTVEKRAAVGDVFAKVLDAKGYSYKGLNSNYISSITTPDGLTMSEFSNGNLSGWMYTVNGTHPNVGLNKYTLSDRDEIIWHYTDDYTQEEGSEKWNKDSNSSSFSTGNATLTPKVTINNGEADVEIAQSDMKDAIAGVKENGGAIVITPEIAGTVNSVHVALQKDSLSTIAAQTSSDLTVQTPIGTVTLPQSILASIGSQAGKSAVTISLEIEKNSALTEMQQKAVGNNTVYDISILRGKSHISSFDGGSITISLPYTLGDGESVDGVVVWYLNDAGELEQMNCSYDKATGMASFATTHLSYYLVSYEASVPWENLFSDVSESDWYYDAVKYVSLNSFMNGTSDTNFEPKTDMTRAMLVTVLYRLAGSPAFSGTNSFTDVKEGQWYADAVIWANSNGIASGYGGSLFGTNDSVTREQLAAILYNYSKYKGCDVTKITDLKAYTDASSISAWAEGAMKWVVGEGLITGTTNTTLSPSGSATRAQVATILMRFCENIAE